MLNIVGTKLKQTYKSDLMINFFLLFLYAPYTSVSRFYFKNGDITNALCSNAIPITMQEVFNW